MPGYHGRGGDNNKLIPILQWTAMGLIVLCLALAIYQVYG